MNLKKYSSFAALLVLLTPFISSCSGEDYEVLRIYNCEDYMYEQSIEDGLLEESLVDQFISYIYETENRNIKVVYDTYDTNESMLSQVKTGKVKYDLICPSDYTIQKMIADDLIIPFEDENGKSTTPIYDEYAAPFLLEKIRNIKVRGKDELGLVNKYSRGYMWGTLGLLCNPEFVDIEDFSYDYSMLWNEKYKNKISIKDSMRDTYALGVLETYKDDFSRLYDEFKSGKIDATSYNNQITTYFNKCDEETLNKVLPILTELKKNIFGFEVDSGKQDIQTGKISINLAWSGDATYAIDTALDEQDIKLNYILPSIGANIWFDGWVMPKGADVELASKFVDFVSSPHSAALNMEGIGYTPVIAHDEIFDLLNEWYGVSEEEYLLDPQSYYAKDLSYFFGESKENSHIIYMSNEDRLTQIDTQYPDKEKLDSLCIMDDFGEQTSDVLRMWEKLKNNLLPLYFYVLVIICLVLIISFFLFKFIKNRKMKADRRNRQKRRKLAKAK